MLIRFEARNFRSLAEKVELSMVAVDRDRPEAREAPSLGESLLPVAAIFGPNASGKSNVLAALAWVCDAVRDSLRFWDREIPIQPFAFWTAAVRSTEFTLEALIGGVRYEYVLEVEPERVIYEGLFHYPQRKRRLLLERVGTELKLQRGLGALSGTRELMTETTLALTVARRFDEPLVADFAEELLHVQPMGQLLRRPRSVPVARGVQAQSAGMQELVKLFWPGASGNEEAKEQVLGMLRLADLGIEDVLVEEREMNALGSGGSHRPRRLNLLHKAEGANLPLDLDQESEGTRTWLELIGPVLTALREGGVILFDELDASLHPTLSAELVRIFHSAVANPLGAQLIFTTHDTSLLNHLNRDEVWLTDKRQDGVTRLGALAEFAGKRVRKSQNLESAYLHGRFGALPQIDEAGLYRALGLIG